MLTDTSVSSLSDNYYFSMIIYYVFIVITIKFQVCNAMVIQNALLNLNIEIIHSIILCMIAKGSLMLSKLGFLFQGY